MIKYWTLNNKDEYSGTSNLSGEVEHETLIRAGEEEPVNCRYDRVNKIWIKLPQKEIPPDNSLTINELLYYNTEKILAKMGG